MTWYGDFFLGAEDGAHGVADFAEGGLGFDSFVDEGHEILGVLGGFAPHVEAALNFDRGAGGRAVGGSRGANGEACERQKKYDTGPSR